MKKTWLIVLVIVASLLMSSCTKCSFMSMEEKIVGSWDFEKVIYKKSPFSSSKNITSEYQDWVFTFTSNGDFSLLQKSNSTTYSGKWSISTITTGTEAPETTYSLFISYFNSNISMVEQIIWEINNIDDTTLDAYSSSGKERWYFTMKRK